MIKMKNMNKTKKIFGLVFVFIFLSSLFPIASFESNKLDKKLENIITEDQIDQDNNFLNPISSSNYNPTGKYVWWNDDFTYRVPIEINSSFIDRNDYSVRINVNFSKYIEEAGWLNLGDPESLDINSIRVVEYTNDTNAMVNYSPILYNANEPIETNRYVIPSKFMPLTYSDYDVGLNATGILAFEMDDLTEANTNRTYMVYFDTIENTGGLTEISSLIWNKDYNARTDPFEDEKFHLAYGSQYEYLSSPYGYFTVWDENLEETLFSGYPHESMTRTYSINAGDFDGNGNVEFLICDIGDEFHLMDYNTDTKSWTHLNTNPWSFEYDNPYYEIGMDQLINEQNWNFYEVVVADIDNDGADEIITTSWNTDDWKGLLVFNVSYNASRPNNPYQFNLEYTMESGPWKMDTIQIADLDKNGYLDIVLLPYIGLADIDYGYTSMIYFNNGSIDWIDNDWSNWCNLTELPKTGYGLTLPNNVFAASIGEIDNDGNIEIVFVDRDNSDYFYFWQCTGPGKMEFEERYRLTYNSPNFAYPIIAGMCDWDNDGYTELMIGNYDYSGDYSSIKVIKVIGDETTTGTRFSEYDNWGNQGNDTIPYGMLEFGRFADVDNDGEVEMVTGSYHGLGDLAGQAAVTVWNQSSLTAQWVSPSKYQYVGTYPYIPSMLLVTGSWSNYVYRMDPNHHIHEGKAKDPNINVVVLDSDYGPVENVKIIVNDSTHDAQYTDINGKITFNYFVDGDYNLTINYSSQMEEVFLKNITVTIDSSNSLEENIVCITDIWQFDLDITDIDGNLFNKGNLTVFNKTHDDNTIISEFDLSEKTRFVWLNRTDTINQYNTTVSYINQYYNPNDNEILNHTVNRIQNSEFGDLFNQTSALPLGGNEFEYIFEFSSPNGNQLNWVNISLTNVSDSISKIEVFLKIGVSESLVDTIVTSGLPSDWNGYSYLWANSNGDLRSDALRSDTVRIKVTSSTSLLLNNGIINVTLSELHAEEIQVPIAKVHLNFTDQDDAPITEGILIYTFNESIGEQVVTDSLVNLTLDEYGFAVDENGEEFYYLTRDGTTEINYSVQVFFYDAFKTFYVDGNPTANTWGNLSFTSEKTSTYKISIDMANIATNITVLTAIPSSINFDQDIIIRLNVTAGDITVDNDDFGIGAYSVTFAVFDTSNNIVFQNNTWHIPVTGEYIAIFNPQNDGISLIEGESSYYIRMSAVTSGYGSNPEPIFQSITINPISASANLYINNDNDLTDVTNSKIEGYWGDRINITLNYHTFTQNLSNAGVTLSWDYGLNQALLQDPNLEPGYYTFEIDTSDAEQLGTYHFKFESFLSNYSKVDNIFLDLVINPRRTNIGANYSQNNQNIIISSTETLLNQRIEINITEAFNMTFVYSEFDTSVVSDADIVSYTWFKYGSNNQIEDTGLGNLVDVGNGKYDLDFDTESLSEGEYTILITIEKEKYTQMQAVITYIISKREISIDPLADLADNFVMDKIKGSSFNFSIELKDLSRGGIPLTNATLTLEIDGLGTIYLTETTLGSGIYSVLLPVDNVKAFFSPETLTGTLTISKLNYEDYSISVTVIVGMEEFAEGIPMFYFVLVVGFISTLVVGIGGYKVIQKARIPEFIKNCSQVEKEISKKKSINTDDLVTSTKNDIVIDELGELWSYLGLDIKNSLGIQKKIPESRNTDGGN